MERGTGPRPVTARKSMHVVALIDVGIYLGGGKFLTSSRRVSSLLECISSSGERPSLERNLLVCGHSNRQCKSGSSCSS